MPDYTTSHGVAVYIECTSGEWIDREVIDRGLDAGFLEPTRQLVEGALGFLAIEGPAVLGVTEDRIRSVLRKATMHFRCHRSRCGRWDNCAGCMEYGYVHKIKWYGSIEHSPFYHELMHSIRPGIPHRLKGEPDSPHDPWWNNEAILNNLYNMYKSRTED